YVLFFFFSSRRRHTRCLSDWSSDVCSSDLQLLWPGTFKGTAHEVIYVYAVILALHALMNIFSVRLVAFLNDVSVWWHVVGVVVIVGFLVFKPDNHQSAATVFSKTINNSGFSHGWLWFVLLLGLLQAQYTYTGYDASAH